jgi:hypothetical protein
MTNLIVVDSAVNRYSSRNRLDLSPDDIAAAMFYYVRMSSGTVKISHHYYEKSVLQQLQQALTVWQTPIT